MLALKRLKIYFNHFTKIQNTQSTIYTNTNNNKPKTFDELNKKYNTINLQQWILFIKCFALDKVYEQKCKNKAISQNKNNNKNNNKNKI